MVSKKNGTEAKAGVTKNVQLPKEKLRNLLKQQGILRDKQSNAKTSANGKKNISKKAQGNVLSSTLTENETNNKSDKKSDVKTMSSDVKKKQNFSKDVLKNMLSSTLTENTTAKKNDAKRDVTKGVPKSKSGVKKGKSGQKDQTLKTQEVTSHNEQSDVAKTDSKVNESIAKSDVAKSTPTPKKSKKSKKQGTLADKQSDVTETTPKKNKTVGKSGKKKSIRKDGPLKKKSQDEERSAGSILVRNLGTKKRSALQTYFEQYGKVKSVKFIKFGWANKKTKKTKQISDNEACAAVVYFIKNASAKAALASDKKKFKDKKLKVTLYSEKPTLSWKRSVSIKNISKDLQEEDIRNRFEDCGEINSVDIVCDEQPDSNSVNAVLNFKTPEAAKAALKLNGKTLFGEESILIERHLPQRPTANKQKPKSKDKKVSGSSQKMSGSSQEISTNDDSSWMQEVLEGAEQDYSASQRKHLVFDDGESSNSLKFNNRRFGPDQRSSSDFRYSAGGDSYNDWNRNTSFDRQGQTFSANQGKRTVFDGEENTNSVRNNNRTFKPHWEGRDQRFSGNSYGDQSNSYGDQSRKRRWEEQDSTFGANRGMQRMNNDMNFQNQSTATNKPKLHIVFDD